MARRPAIDDQLQLVALWTERGRALPRITSSSRGELRGELQRVQRAAWPVLGAQLEPRLRHAQERGLKRAQQPLRSLLASACKARSVLGHDLLESRQLAGLRAAQIEGCLALAQRAGVAQARVAAVRINVQRDSIEQLAARRRVCIHQLDITWMEHDRRRTRCVARQTLRFFAVEQHAALLVPEHRALLARVIAVLDLGAHAGKIFTLLD